MRDGLNAASRLEVLALHQPAVVVRVRRLSIRTILRTSIGLAISATWRLSIVAVTGLVMTAAVVHAQKVNVDSNPAAPWTTYKTYAWVNGIPAPDQLNDQRLHASIDERLAARGLTKNTSAPDLIVTTNVTTQQRQELVPSGFAYGPWWGGYGDEFVDTWVEGTLVVDFNDAKTKQMVWRDVATATASEKPTKNIEKMNKALDKMFEKFPISASYK
jgi:hypothetical protein